MRGARAAGAVGLLAGALLFAVSPPRADAFVALRLRPSGAYVRYEASRFPLPFQIQDRTALGAVANLAPGSDVMGAVRAAMNAWREIPTATIRFADLVTTGLESTSVDDVNLITMANTAANTNLTGGANGTLALTRVVFSASTGRIVETDIVLNPSYNFSTNLARDTFDLQSILTHELGHALGADHAAAVNDTMFFAVGRETFFPRYLSADAVAFASFAYPNAERSGGKSSITGSVTQSGRGVFGASVTAVDLEHNRIITTLSETDGSYTINGLVAAKYLVYAEPLDGPASTDDLSGTESAYYRNLNTTFRTVFSEEVRIAHDAGAGAAAAAVDANFALAETPATANINRLGRGDANLIEGSVATRPVVVSPGETLALLVAGPDTWRTQSIDDVEVLGDGITIDRARGIRVLRSQAGAEAGIGVVIRVAGDAAPGPRSVRLRIGDQRIAATGAVVVTDRRLPQQVLYMPYLVSSPEVYTGIALANPSDVAATVHIKSHDAAGMLLYDQEAIVPAALSIPGGSQTARVERQVFNLPAGASKSGSITVESDSPSLQGFFLAGDLDGNYLDGAEALTLGRRKLVFVDVMQSGVTSTELHLLNVSDTRTTVQLQLVGSGGATLAGPVTRVIQPHGKIGDSVSTLFSYSADLTSAYVVASASEESLAGFTYVRQAGTVFGNTAQSFDAGHATLFSPQLASGNFGVPYRTRFSVVNVGESATSLSFTVTGDDGGTLAGPVSGGQLPAGGQLTLDAESFFGFRSAIQGSVKIVGSAGAKLLGNVFFGDGNPQSAALRFGASLPLSGTGSSSFIFSQVAQAAGFYTGIALFAPEGADATVEAYREDGTVSGTASVKLAPGARRVAVLEVLIPSTRDQQRGYIKVSSTRPVIGFELFGATDGRFLAAVTPQPLR